LAAAAGGDDRSLLAPLGGYHADRGDGGGGRTPARGGEDPAWGRVELRRGRDGDGAAGVLHRSRAVQSRRARDRVPPAALVAAAGHASDGVVACWAGWAAAA